MVNRAFWCVILSLAFLGCAFGQDGAGAPGAGIDEKLGEYVPLEHSFLDENSKLVLLRDIVDRPVIITFVYFRCGHICPRLLGGLAEVVGKLDLEPGKDYKLITISFDPEDTPQAALQNKANFVKAANKPFPEEAWRFLTGDAESIRKITEATGFRFRKEERGFSHTTSLIMLSPDGKIIRYLYGVTFLPFDVKMALAEASEGRAGSTTGRVLLYCFSYDPKGRKYVFNLLAVVGAASVLFAVSFFAYLMMTSGRHRRKEG